MPLINYAVLRDLLARFDALASDIAAGPERRRRLEDVQYTVCVYTGLRDPGQAVARARLLLDEARSSRG